MNSLARFGLCIIAGLLLTTGAQAVGFASSPSISPDGRYVMFDSAATNLVTGDTNGVRDVFVRDRTVGVTYQISKNSAGEQGNGDSYGLSISSDGRNVTFSSDATNLVPGDTNGVRDVFVNNRQTGKTTCVSKSTAGVQGNSGSYEAAISSDSRYVVFSSLATNLVPGDTNGVRDIFVRDRQTGTTVYVSKSTAGVRGNSASYRPVITSNGRYVAFYSFATNLVAGDTNAAADIFVRDRQTGTTTRVSKNTTGGQADNPSYAPSISSDGRYVAFDSSSKLVPGDTNQMRDIFVRDRTAGVTYGISKSSAGEQGNSPSYSPSISSDGRYVAFYSFATNLVAGDTNGKGDIFVRDRQNGTTSRVSKSSAGVQGNGESTSAAISANGRYVAFVSAAANLVTGDTNGNDDIFVRDRWTGKTYLVSKS